MTYAREAVEQYRPWLGVSSNLPFCGELDHIQNQWRQRCLIFVTLVVPVGLLGVFPLDLSSTQLAVVIILGQVGARKTYHLSVHVDPKINAMLLLEKRRTGMTISEIVEKIFREYQRRREGKGPLA
ncbi:MAG: hypothetical protein SA339_07160 [Methanomassiliicoccus sp.]|nr:hypothetical protein [Methanomassiliicoccus sp.]